MIRALDRNVGHVMSALKANGLDQNTLVIFTSDNGGANYIGLPNINRPYRGWKATFFEGGIHVPFFMQMAGENSRGHDIQFADCAHRHLRDRRGGGRCAVADRSRDGRRQRHSVCHGASTGTPHGTLYWRSGSYKTLLDGEWKLQVSARPERCGCSI